MRFASSATARNWIKQPQAVPPTVGSARVRWHSRDLRGRSTARNWAAPLQLHRRRAPAPESSAGSLSSREQPRGAMRAHSRVRAHGVTVRHRSPPLFGSGSGYGSIGRRQSPGLSPVWPNPSHKRTSAGRQQAPGRRCATIVCGRALATCRLRPAFLER
jgi:hypothetical protein